MVLIHSPCYTRKKNSYRLLQDNVTLTSHIGGVAIDTHDGFAQLCLDNLKRVLIEKTSPLTVSFSSIEVISYILK